MKILQLTLFSLCFAFAGPAAAQEYPSRPITLVVPFPPGGVADILGRLIAQKVGSDLGTQIVVDNKPGAGGAIGAQFVASAKPDGYTILYGSDLSLVNYTLVTKNPLFVPDKAFVPVHGVLTTPWMLAVRPDAPYKTLRELIEFARRNPGRITYFTTGVGTSHHVMGELLQKSAGVTLTQVPYRGGPQGYQDFLGGRLDLMMDYANTWAPYVAGGKAIPVGVASAARLAAAPNVPTFAEQGHDVAFGPFSVLAVPAGTPKAVIERLSAAMARLHKDPEFVKFAAERGSVPLSFGPAEARTFLDQRYAWMKRFFDELGIKPE